jgi:uncharacterized protein
MLKKFSLIWLGISVTLYLGICLLLRLGQTRLMFFPDSLLRSTPAKHDLVYQDVWLSVNTQQVHGWWIPSSDLSPVLLYLHGNGSNNGDGVDLAAAFHQLGLSVLLLDYRGYGKSDRIFPNETRVYEDAEAAWNYLTHEQKIIPENIFVYGHSLGGAIAIELATKHPEMAGLIVTGTFTSIRNIVNLNSLLQIFPLNWLLTQHFDSIAKIKSLQVPLLIIHGTADEVIPVAMGQKLYAAAPEPKQLVVIPGGDHNNLFRVGGQQYLSNLQQFIQTNSQR